MRRARLITPLLTAALCGTATLPAAAPAATDRPALGVRVTECVTGALPADRAATFTGAMPSRTGALRMQMRFALQQRADGAAGWTTVAVPGWNGWVRSDPGHAGFVYARRVDALATASSYRARVTYRWLASDGALLRTTHRTSAGCHQPDRRPDLLLAGLTGVKTDPGQAVYNLIIANAGLSDAGPFGAEVSLSGRRLGTVAVPGLAAGARTQAFVNGARCAPGSTLVIVLDRRDQVDEVDEEDDVVRRPCPFGSAGS